MRPLPINPRGHEGVTGKRRGNGQAAAGLMSGGARASSETEGAVCHPK